MQICNMHMCRRWFVSFCCLFITFSCWLSLGCSNANNQENISIPSIAVTTTKVKTQSIPQLIPSVGTLRANQISTIAPELPGRLMEIRFSDGQNASEGDVLAVIDNRTELATYQAAVAAYKENEWKYQQTRELYKAQAATDYEVTQARFMRDRSASLVKEARERLDKLTIVAPYDGRLSIRVPDIGDYLSEGSPIVDIVDDDPMLVDYYLSEKYIDLLKTEQPIFIQFPNENKTFQGKVDAVNPLIDQLSRSVKVRASFANPNHELASGRFVTVNHQIGILQNKMVIPQEAVALNTNEANVYVIKQSNEQQSDSSTQQFVEIRAIRLGQFFRNLVVVEEGLQPGEEIVVTGWDKLRDDVPVHVVPTISTEQTPTTTWIEPRVSSFVEPESGKEEILNESPSEENYEQSPDNEGLIKQNNSASEDIIQPTPNELDNASINKSKEPTQNIQQEKIER
ncbi:efflux RND transporter periplasmic adaptor subunit [Planctomycetota bacterium]|nr:efflux RND transporter periplasmic adaptor subunit [Planctomycetota bacterium]